MGLAEVASAVAVFGALELKLYSYVITHDYGFAPNPFGGKLTLATCKPKIRRNAKSGDHWIMGTGSKNSVGTNKLIFAGKISSVISLEEYGSSDLYKIKIPNKNGESWQKRGDNIYYKDENNCWLQRINPFHNQEHFDTDIAGENVIICEVFWYFGELAPIIPKEFISLIKVGTGHKNNVKNSVKLEFIEWLQNFPKGIQGQPSSLKKSSSQ